MFIRKLGMIIRGESTPSQIMMACVLGALLGFMPGFTQAMGSILLLTLLLILFNANLKIAGLTLLLSKLAALVLLPVTFHVGRWGLDGPLQGLFQALVNAPVLALFGFEYYATTGGWAVGLAFGLILGALLVRAITAFRRKMASLETGSPRFQEFVRKRWVKMAAFVLAGGAGKLSYEQILQKKSGHPLRPLGLVFAGLLGLLLVIVYAFASGPIVTMVVQNSLERANGATVDVEAAHLSFKEGRLIVSGLAMADRNALESDLFRAAKLEADISNASLFRKRLQLERVVISEATHGEKRAVRGHHIGRPPEPRKEREERAYEWPDAKTLEDYFHNAKVWKERLAQVRDWMEKIGGDESAQEPLPGATHETWRERLEREVQEKGYAHVKASHLVERSPTLTIVELIAEKVRAAQRPGETLDIVAQNLSTHPRLLGKAPRFSIRSNTDLLGLELVLGAFDAAPSENLMNFHYRGLPTDSVAQHLRVAGQTPVQGGTIDMQFQGILRGGREALVDLPLEVTLHETTFALPQMKEQRVRHFTLPIAVRGPLDNPRIHLDDKQLASSLARAGVARATDELVNRAQEKINDQVGSRLGEQGQSLLKGILKRPSTVQD
jgi:uncharacterized protein (TIGR03546 family)